ncbi:MAG: YbhB/YbcL family Raf kinase inhibitor-like protein [Candidatus Omnitrophota bacterium]
MKGLWAIMLVLNCMLGIPAAAAADFALSSFTVEPNQSIPLQYTCQGENVNPPLNIKGIPAGTKSLALIVDDPDASNGTWVHWIVYNIPPTDSIEENSIPGREGWNDFGKKSYGGPCPPDGTHRYFFKLYALDTVLDLTGKVDSSRLQSAMKGHILGTAALVGVYQKIEQAAQSF